MYLDFNKRTDVKISPFSCRKPVKTYYKTAIKNNPGGIEKVKEYLYKI